MNTTIKTPAQPALLSTRQPGDGYPCFQLPADFTPSRNTAQVFWSTLESGCASYLLAEAGGMPAHWVTQTGLPVRLLSVNGAGQVRWEVDPLRIHLAPSDQQAVTYWGLRPSPSAMEIVPELEELYPDAPPAAPVRRWRVEVTAEATYTLEAESEQEAKDEAERLFGDNPYCAPYYAKATHYCEIDATEITPAPEPED